MDTTMRERERNRDNKKDYYFLLSIFSHSVKSYANMASVFTAMSTTLIHLSTMTISAATHRTLTTT